MTLNKQIKESRRPTDISDLEEIGANITIAEMRKMLSLTANVATLANRLRQGGVKQITKGSGPAVYETSELTRARLREVFAYRPPKPKDSIESLGGLDAYKSQLALRVVKNSVHNGDNGVRRGRNGSVVRNI